MSRSLGPIRCFVSSRVANLRLLIRTGPYCCALPVSAVVETMRPLPIQKLKNAPPGVIGVSIVRGCPTPLLDLAALLHENSPSAYTRFVSLRVAQRTVALAVDTVIGIRDFGISSPLPAIPPLFQQVRPEVIEAMTAVDSELVLVLRSAELVPPDQDLTSQET